MYYATKRGYINVILSVIIIAVLLVFVAWLAYNTGRNAAEGAGSPFVQHVTNGIEIPLAAISLAENASLQGTTGLAKIDIPFGRVEIDILLPDARSLPEGTVLSAWLVDAGKLGGLGTSSVSEEDQQYGTPYANTNFSERSDSIPFARALGSLVWSPERETFHQFFLTHDDLTPYDAVMITLESDGNKNNYDPRPGTPVVIGEISAK